MRAEPTPGPLPEPNRGRRARRLALAVLAGWWMLRVPVASAAPPGHPDVRWYRSAEAMRQQALGWGDQAYGAVLVLGDALVGEGPSRVVIDRNPDAHAERVAILDAQRRLGRKDLSGTVLYATSRPCVLCEQAAARANVARTYFGAGLHDAGPPRGQP